MPISVGIGCDRRIFFTYLLFPDVVQAQIGHDPVNPGVKRALKPEAPDVLVGLQERVLINILGFVFRSGKVQCEPQHRLVVVVYQFLERSTAAALRLANEHRVINPAWYLAQHAAPGFCLPRFTALLGVPKRRTLRRML